MTMLGKRRLGKTGIEATALGLGCAHLGHPARARDDEAIEAVRHAIDLVMNLVDTSAMYGRGHSERRVGLALQDGYREKVESLIYRCTPGKSVWLCPEDHRFPKSRIAEM